MPEEINERQRPARGAREQGPALDKAKSTVQR